MPNGYSVVYTATTADGTDVTVTAINGSTLTMPAADVTVTATGTLQAFDVMGRLLFSREVSGSKCEIPTLNFPSAGVYVLRLDGKSQKIVIN